MIIKKIACALAFMSAAIAADFVNIESGSAKNRSAAYETPVGTITLTQKSVQIGNIIAGDGITISASSINGCPLDGPLKLSTSGEFYLALVNAGVL